MQWMEESGVRPNVVTFTTLMHAYAGRGDAAGSEAVLARMLSADVRPNVRTYTTLLSAHAANGDVQRSEGVLARMLEACVAPNVMTWTTLMTAYTLSGDVQGAERVLKRMEVAYVAPNANTFSTLMHAYTVNGDIKVREDHTYPLQPLSSPRLFHAHVPAKHRLPPTLSNGHHEPLPMFPPGPCDPRRTGHHKTTTITGSRS